MQLPTFRYLDDAVKLVKQIAIDVDEVADVNRAKIKMKAQAEEFVIRSPGKKHKALNQITPQREEVKIPGGVKQLKQQYSVLEDLNDKYQSLDAISTQIQMQFHNNRDLQRALGEVTKAKNKIEQEMRIIFQFLNDIAQAKVPASFQEYVNAVNQELNEHVAFANSSQFLYVNTSDEGSIQFTNYTVLTDAANDDGELATLYIAVKWDMGTSDTNSVITVHLDHDFELPGRLHGGTQVQNVQSAVRALANMLEVENFSSSLGIIPLSLQLKVKPEALKSELFSYRDYISKIKVDDQESAITFTLRRDTGVNEEAARKVAQQLFLELKSITTKRKNTKLRTSISKDNGIWTIKFSIHGIAQGMELDMYDLEFLRDRFQLNDQQLRRISNIIRG